MNGPLPGLYFQVPKINFWIDCGHYWMYDLGVFGLLKSLVIFLASEVFKPSIHVAKRDSELMGVAAVDENMCI